MLHRKPNQARYEFEIRGITREHTLTDFLSRTGGDSSECDGTNHRLDRAQFESGHTDTIDVDRLDFGQELDDLEMLALSIESMNTRDAEDSFEGSENVIRQRRSLVQEAMNTLTDRQAWAIGLWTAECPEREAAAQMGISQPTYHEILHGKSGVGGAIRKIRKHFEKHPIA